MFVSLEIGADLPSDEQIEQWQAEHVKNIVLKMDIFLSNKKGFPVLSKYYPNLTSF
jgi:protein arginine N-methyltransferase 5